MYNEREPTRDPWILLELFFFAAGLILSITMLVFSVIRMYSWWSEYGSGMLISVTVFFFMGIALYSSLRWSAFIIFSLLGRWKLMFRVRNTPASHPCVSILVPCFNESTTIVPAMESLLELDYPNYEIIIIDDGSTDDTLQKARQYEGRFGGVTVRVFSKPNGGKWSALNTGFQNSTSELLLCVDADSRLDPESLQRMVLRMENPMVSVVAGQVRVRNRHKLLTRLQALEYQIGNGALRMSQSFFGTVLVVPGPIGLFRRSVMEEIMFKYVGATQENLSAGPFEGNTFAEDFDLSLAVLTLGDRGVYEPEAVSYTQAPERLFTLISQRYRWIRGSVQVMRKFLARAYEDPGSIRRRLWAWLSVTYLLELTISPLLGPIGIILFLFSLGQPGALLPFMLWLAAYVLVQTFAAGYFLLMHKDRLSLLHVVPFFEAYMGFVMGSAWTISVIDEFRGSKMRWS